MRLIDKYLPSDYSDSVSKKIKPVDWLFKLRNAIVKPFGLQGGGGNHTQQE